VADKRSGPRAQKRDRNPKEGVEHKDLPGGYKNPYRRYRKLERPVLEAEMSTLWDYPSQQYGTGTQGSQHYVGATPSFVIWNFLQRFTRAGETILDPFCGSGTTLDVCRDLERKGRGFDVAPHRDDIEEGDARGLPLDDASVDHAFLDPPYADNLAYSDDPRCIGKTRADDRSYYKAMAGVFDELSRVVKPGGMIAVYVSDVMHDDGFHPLGIELANLGRERFVLVDHVVVKRYGRKVERDDEKRKAAFGAHLARGFNHLLLFRVSAARRAKSTGPARDRTSASGRGHDQSGGRASRPSHGKPSHGARGGARSEGRDERGPGRQQDRRGGPPDKARADRDGARGKDRGARPRHRDDAPGKERGERAYRDDAPDFNDSPGRRTPSEAPRGKGGGKKPFTGPPSPRSRGKRGGR